METAIYICFDFDLEHEKQQIDLLFELSSLQREMLSLKLKLYQETTSCTCSNRKVV